MKEYLIDGHRVPAQKVGETLWFHWKGQTYSVPVTQAKTARRRSAGGNASDQSGEIRAPMPGKITQLRAAVGDMVKAGQVVLVMEAMKMEYTLKTSVAGKVQSIQCKTGEQVQADQVLAEIVAEGSK